MCVKNDSLNLDNVNTLNIQVVIYVSNSDFNDTIVIVKKDRIIHLINRLQVQNFALSLNFDSFLFSIKFFRNKKDGGNFIQYEDLLNVQEDNGNATAPGILYYYKRIPTMVLVNECILLRIINRARTIFYGVISNLFCYFT